MTAFKKKRKGQLTRQWFLYVSTTNNRQRYINHQLFKMFSKWLIVVFMLNSFVVQWLSRVRLCNPIKCMRHASFRPLPSPGACSNSCPLNQWCHPTISSSVTLFSCPQSFLQLSKTNNLTLKLERYRHFKTDVQVLNKLMRCCSALSAIRSDQISRSVVSNSLRPHESQHARPPCPSPTPRVHSDSCPSSQWCYPATSSSVVPFSSCPQPLPASESFPMSQLFTWGGQSTGVSASASVLQFSSVAQSCPTLCDPMNHSTPGLPVHHQLPEFTQTHSHRFSDAIQPSHPLSSPSPPAPNPSQHQSLFQWVNSSHEVAKVLKFHL